MKINKLGLVFLFVIVVWSCGDDDGLLNGVVPVPIQTLAETAPENDAEIIAYLQTHFYNYEEFANPPAGFNFQIRIDTIEGDNSDKTPILDREELSFMDINVSSSAFPGIDEENDISHRLYYLSAREGSGEAPTVVDSVFIEFEGFDLEGNIFQENSQMWFDLLGTGIPTNSGNFVRGFEEGLTFIRDGDELIENGDGTFNIIDSGIGVVFMPSGLGFFNALTVGQPYTPIAFRINLLETNIADHDRDGVSTRFEDINNDDDFFNDDTDGNTLPNYLDSDDDGDGIPTRDEIEIDAQGNVTFPDSDNDGTPDYLDSDS